MGLGDVVGPHERRAAPALRAFHPVVLELQRTHCGTPWHRHFDLVGLAMKGEAAVRNRAALGHLVPSTGVESTAELVQAWGEALAGGRCKCTREERGEVEATQSRWALEEQELGLQASQVGEEEGKGEEGEEEAEP